MASIPSRAVMSSVPPAISAFSSAWTASSPLRSVNVPPSMRIEPFVWTASSRASIRQAPPLTVTPVPALTPLLDSEASPPPAPLPPPAVTLISAFSARKAVSAWMPSLPETMLSEESTTET